MNKLTKVGCSALCGSLAAISAANAGFDAQVGLESRYFFEEGLQQQAKSQPSISAELNFEHVFESSSVAFSVFTRFDFEDEERTHTDLREALWTYVGDEWEVKAGVGKVFWGVTESRHLVDVINQSDLVEGLDGEEKLGQPMTKFSLEKEWGTLDLFWLPYFRERTFAGEDGRLLFYPSQISEMDAGFSSNAENWHSDFAVRYSHYWGELEYAISHFTGTSRDPLIDYFNLRPFYTTVDQTGLELQYIYEEWLFKFEGITNSGVGERYSAAVFGFEYTQVGIWDSSADLGWLVEYLFDDRRNQKDPLKAAPHNFERDIFLAWRYALNDAGSSEVLGGLIYDPRTEEVMYTIEASKRIGDDLKLKLEARVFDGAEEKPFLKTHILRDEDYIQLELVKYF